jgi:NADH:ubiquinone reductase (H+-translocating)
LHPFYRPTTITATPPASGRNVITANGAIGSREELDDVYALGDCARVPNEATPERHDPPTCQHALRQAKALARTLHGDGRPYRYKSIGEGATLGRDKGIARLFRIKLRGGVAAFVTRFYHLQQVPLLSRRRRILADGLLSTVLRRDMVELGSIQQRQIER